VNLRALVLSCTAVTGALLVLSGCGSTDTSQPAAPSVAPLPTVTSTTTATTTKPTTTSRTTTPAPTTTTPVTTTSTEVIVVPPAVDSDVDLDRPYVPAPVPFVAPAPVPFVAPAPVAPAPAPAPVAPAPVAPSSVFYGSCAEVRAAGAAPIYAGEPGYSTKLDRDKDGVACET
jgi:hypothetical protein